MRIMKFDAKAVLELLPASTVDPCAICERELDYIDNKAILCSHCNGCYCAKCWDTAKLANKCNKCNNSVNGHDTARVDKSMVHWVEALIARARSAVSDLEQGIRTLKSKLFKKY
jgi:hypothetical protein